MVQTPWSEGWVEVHNLLEKVNSIVAEGTACKRLLGSVAGKNIICFKSARQKKDDKEKKRLKM